jgi:ribonucleoside-diphosphate reductase alpha chain
MAAWARPSASTSVAQLVHRVVDTIADWGKDGRYFAHRRRRRELPRRTGPPDAHPEGLLQFARLVQRRREERTAATAGITTKSRASHQEARPANTAAVLGLLHQLGGRFAGIHPDLAKTEGMLFKWGSGTGTNLSKLREEDAILSGGGRASGPLSFMKGFDAFAGVIKSGGKTRRAAKMVILNADHPDIEQFIWCKAKEEKKAHTLIDAGYDSSLDGEAYSSIFFQNANNSVRATDDFMQAVPKDADWWTKSVVTGSPVKRYKARDLLRQIAEATTSAATPACSSTPRSTAGTPAKNTAASTPRTRARSTCSSTIRPATCVAEPDEVPGPDGSSTWKPSATPSTR